ncbi:hypothetical protein HI330_004280 [Escherichia coli]|nr:hypothetical protein [Escherichia coli]EGE6785382.1 hypothetical protein [Escherichia coli]ELF2677505.1 hypothetical protein [Escherichia coli]
MNVLKVSIGVIFILCACKDSHENFTGVWQQKNTKQSQCKSELRIKYSKGVYHIDKKYYNDKLAKESYSNMVKDYFSGKTKVKPFRDTKCSTAFYQTISISAKYLNENTLAGNGISFLFEKGEIKSGNEIYVKQKEI